jgi:hypothetical protein
MEGQPICLKLGKFAASRADHELGHERGPVGLHRQGARGHGEFIIVSKTRTQNCWLLSATDGHAVLTPLQRPSEQGRAEQIIGAPPSKIRLGSLASFFTGAKLLNQHLVLLG